jgi:hypothetical protein
MVGGNCSNLNSVNSLNSSCLNNIITYFFKGLISRSPTNAELDQYLNVATIYLNDNSPNNAFLSVLIGIMIHPLANFINLPENSQLLNGSTQVFQLSHRDALRRVFIGVAGTLPTVAAVTKWENGDFGDLKTTQGMQKLIDYIILLENPSYKGTFQKDHHFYNLCKASH